MTRIAILEIIRFRNKFAMTNIAVISLKKEIHKNFKLPWIPNQVGNDKYHCHPELVSGSKASKVKRFRTEPGMTI